MIIAVASGKGGTGKTTVATSLAAAVPADVFLDCDVEAPDAHLFLRPTLEHRKNVDLLIPEVDLDACTACGICDEVCQFNAIVLLNKNPLVFPVLCHGCGSCTLNCPEGAIREVPRTLGVLESGKAIRDIQFAHGLLNVGEPMAVPAIHQLKAWKSKGDSALEIRDAPPGTSCPVVESIQGADFVLLVTEPTPFGLHDLKLAAQVVQELNLPAGVVVNRDDQGMTSEVDAFCQEQGLPILMRIPLERTIAEGTARGQTLIEIYPTYTERFQTLLDDILRRSQNHSKKDRHRTSEERAV
ncbi:MAG: ATP-binding protein [Anaerolineales bacterium]